MEMTSKVSKGFSKANALANRAYAEFVKGLSIQDVPLGMYRKDLEYKYSKELDEYLLNTIHLYTSVLDLDIQLAYIIDAYMLALIDAKLSFYLEILGKD